MATPSGHQFKTGNICRIYIKNFLTFKEVEVRPKPKLNVICGPNGSGKSTILCAICLCLGGKPNVIGRSKEVYNYVKMGESVAVLEVEVYVEQEINAVITHRINKATRKCTWQLQGKEVTHRTVMQRIEGLNIQVDNLCQFLPQDRVVSFAKMNCQELLVATEKAVGDPSLFEDHKSLCTSGQELTSLETRIRELQSKVIKAEKRNARLKDVVDNLEVKQKLEADLQQLKTQRAWYLYDHKRKIHQDHKEKLKERNDELSLLKHKIAPTLNKITERTSTLGRMRSVVKEKTELIRRNQQTSLTLQAQGDTCLDKLKEAKRKFSTQAMEEELRRTELEDFQRQLDVFLGQMQNLPELNEAEVTQRMKELTDKIQKTSQKIVRQQGRASEINASMDVKSATIKTLTKELNTLQDVTGQRLELLRSFNRDVYRATQWIQNNRNSFKGLVYPPICALLNVKSQQYARYIENRVMERDLVAFVCEDRDDVNTLKQEMDRQKMCVNVVFANPHDLGKYKAHTPIAALRKYGFETYLLDCITAPPAILAFLCQIYSLHTVPIGAAGDYDAVPPKVSVFYLGKTDTDA